jgi:hypothetical protein
LACHCSKSMDHSISVVVVMVMAIVQWW